ncbi:MAG: MCE family protein [Candidatus Omnitrophica bacterium]|nr:MCE family protein [Candidatus Omnitrophota bacterium]MBU4418430.1 MCE family protein [Candidatus Omnitrophota bacterium]MBU4467912.1 MCE family protein [Candidatus Omnitrophota bacterium]MCG2707120.1 MlaD family protein [Candidatus Omnitrophota bacterium]
MIFGKTKLELKVGIFVFIGLIILVVFILSIGGLKTWSSGYRINLNFNFINGVKIGAPVRFAGLDVGEVKKIGLQFIPQENRSVVRLEAWVRDIVRIPADSTVWVNTLGLLGEKYVEIIPGKDYANFLKDNQSLIGVDPLPIHEIFNRAESILRNLDDGIMKIRDKEGSLGKLLYDDAVYNELEALLTDVRKNPWKLLIKTKEKK